MKNMIKFTDAITGVASIKKDFSGKDFTVINDSTSNSGKSLVAQIEMTHAGIVTRNNGFYLPDNMRNGAHTFTTDYKKPVLVGHDSDSDPVGRVTKAEYVNTSDKWIVNDKYLKSLINFSDKRNKKKSNEMLDFTQHVIREYQGKDDYRGLGHILGTLKITDKESIEKILDERYLTVSISMSSDAAFCSECGQDWVSEGRCEHERGQTYDSGIPVVLIPGAQSYNHVGFVSEPADIYAAGLKGIELITEDGTKQLDAVIQEKNNLFSDKFSVVANLFSYQDSKLISLSDETNTDLIVVKDNIQEIEDSLKPTENEKMKKGKFADSVSANISLYLYGDNGESASIELRKYAESLSPEDLEKLAKKAAAALATQQELTEDNVKQSVFDYLMLEMKDSKDEGQNPPAKNIQTKKVKALNDRFKLVDSTEYNTSEEEETFEEIQKIEGLELSTKDAKELASLIVRSKNGDALASLSLQTKDKTVEECVRSFLEIKDSMFKINTISETELAEKMNSFLPDDSKIDLASFESIDSKNCAGSGKYFPILNKNCVEASKKILALTLTSDSTRGRILENIEKLASKIPSEESENKDSVKEVVKNFDSVDTECNNQVELNDDALMTKLEELVQLAKERNLIDSIIAPFLADKEEEIGVLEQQLILANDEIEELLTDLSVLKDSKKVLLAEKIVDAKIKSGLFNVSDRESEVKLHSERSEESLQDMFEDFNKVKISTISDNQKVTSPVLVDGSETFNTQIVRTEEAKINADLKKKDNRKNSTYVLLKNNRGQAAADSWLATQN